MSCQSYQIVSYENGLKAAMEWFYGDIDSHPINE